MCSGVQDPKLMDLGKSKGTAMGSKGMDSGLTGSKSLAPLENGFSSSDGRTNPLNGIGIGAGEMAPAAPKPFADSGMAGADSSNEMGNWSMPSGDLERRKSWLDTEAGIKGLADRTGNKGIGGGPLPGLATTPKTGSLVQPLNTGLLTPPVKTGPLSKPLKSVVPGGNANTANATQPQLVSAQNAPEPKAAAAPESKTEAKQPPAGPEPQSESQQWVNPTGGPIRSDGRGDGKYKAPRGKKLHAGMDFQGNPGDPVRAPFDGTLEIVPDGVRITQPGSEQGPRYCARMLHFDPSVSDRIQVKAGQVIGTLQDLSKLMHKDMKSHVHLEAYEIDKQGKSKNVDPTLLIPMY